MKKKLFFACFLSLISYQLLLAQSTPVLPDEGPTAEAHSILIQEDKAVAPDAPLGNEEELASILGPAEPETQAPTSSADLSSQSLHALRKEIRTPASSEEYLFPADPYPLDLSVADAMKIESELLEYAVFKAERTQGNWAIAPVSICAITNWLAVNSQDADYATLQRFLKEKNLKKKQSVLSKLFIPNDVAFILANQELSAKAKSSATFLGFKFFEKIPLTPQVTKALNQDIADLTGYENLIQLTPEDDLLAVATTKIETYWEHEFVPTRQGRFNQRQIVEYLKGPVKASSCVVNGYRGEGEWLTFPDAGIVVVAIKTDNPKEVLRHLPELRLTGKRENALLEVPRIKITDSTSLTDLFGRDFQLKAFPQGATGKLNNFKQECTFTLDEYGFYTTAVTVAMAAASMPPTPTKRIVLDSSFLWITYKKVPLKGERETNYIFPVSIAYTRSIPE